MHTLLDMRGNIPSFIHISDGKLHDVNILDPLIQEAGAFYVMDRGYIDFARLHRLHQAGSFFVTGAKKNTDAQRRYSHPVDRSAGVRFDQTLVLPGYRSAKGVPAAAARCPLQGPGDREVTAVHHQQHCVAGAEHLCSVQSQVELFLRWIKRHLSVKAFFRHYRERRQVPNLDRRVGLRSCGHCANASRSLGSTVLERIPSHHQASQSVRLQAVRCADRCCSHAAPSASDAS